MKLAVHERLALLELLPKQGSYAGLKTIRKAKEIFSFTPEEMEFYKLHINDKNRWEWDRGKASERILDAPVEEYIIDIIREKLAEMNKKGTMTETYVSLYEKFIINYRSVEK